MEEGRQILGESQDRNVGQLDLVTLTADIVAAYVSNNRVPPAEMPVLLASVHAAVAGLGSPPATVDAGPEKPTPAQIRKSIKPDALISFIDGKPYKTLKRHLRGVGITIEEYRERFGLPRDYPSTAASYSEQRSALAKSLGLGQRRRKAVLKVVGTGESIANVPEADEQNKPAAPVGKDARTRKAKKSTSDVAAE